MAVIRGKMETLSHSLVANVAIGEFRKEWTRESLQRIEQELAGNKKHCLGTTDCLSADIL